MQRENGLEGEKDIFCLVGRIGLGGTKQSIKVPASPWLSANMCSQERVGKVSFYYIPEALNIQPHLSLTVVLMQNLLSSQRPVRPG